ncbi:MAG: transglycosylase domain-containing protein [Frankiaceae bacterium]
MTTLQGSAAGETGAPVGADVGAESGEPFRGLLALFDDGDGPDRTHSPEPRRRVAGRRFRGAQRERSYRARPWRLLAVAVAVGVLVAGLLTPAGLLVRAGAEAGYRRFGPLPISSIPVLPERSELLAADGTRLGVFFEQNRRSLPEDAMPRVLAEAAVAIEDVRFFDHGAVDPRGVLRAAVVNLRSGGSRQGGSTITMQLAKNLRALSAPTRGGQRSAVAETVTRKVHDMRYAEALEQRLSKRRILLTYLNAVYFGDGVYGAQAAAEHFFGSSAGRLTVPQAALLAGTIQNPQANDPVRHPRAARERRDAVLTAMRGSGALTASAAARAMATPVRLHLTRLRNGCVGSVAPFFCDWVRDQLMADPALGDTVTARQRTLETAGLTIRTTLQPRVQRAAQAALGAAIPPSTPVAAAITAVQPGSGAVVAMAVSRPFGADPRQHQTMVNLATGGASGYQVGSTFKPFVLAAALTRRIPLSTKLHCPQRYISTAFPKDRPFPYPVANAGDSEAGSFTITGATWQSVNTCYLQIEERTGLRLPAGIAESLGVRRLPGDQPLHRVPSLTLGTNETSPLAMTVAYAAFAAAGRYCPPTGVRSVQQPQRVLRLHRPACRQALDARVARTVTGVLRGVIDGPDPHRTGLRASIRRPAAGKTGTTQNYSAAWFIGYTRQLAAAVWLGDPAGDRPLRRITINGRYYRQVFGGDLPARIWAATMRRALASTKPTPLP